MEKEEQDPDSILNYYRRLTALRKEYPVIQKGDIAFLYRDQQEVFAYRCCLGGQELLALNNLSGEPVKLSEPVPMEGYQMLIENYPEKEKGEWLEGLRPYESIVLFHA